MTPTKQLRKCKRCGKTVDRNDCEGIHTCTPKDIGITLEDIEQDEPDLVETIREDYEDEASLTPSKEEMIWVEFNSLQK